MEPDLARRFAQAQVTMREAAGVALAYHRDLASLTIRHKGPQDLVSEADRETERVIKRSLLEAFPEDGFVGEETGADSVLPGRGVWVVDPIDGTQPFLLGFPTWCVSIAYVRDGEVLLGLITNPATGDEYAALRGHGTTWNGRPARVRDATSLSEGVTGVGCSLRTTPDDLSLIMHRLLSAGGIFRRTGSGALDLAYVAVGQQLGMIEMHINSWDCAAALCLISEAGGVSTDFLRSYGITGGGPLVVGSPGVFDQLLALLPPTAAELGR